MCYANQVIGGGDGARGRERSPMRARRHHRGRPHARRGRPVRARRRRCGLAVVYLVAPTTPADRRRVIAARSGGFLYCVSLVGVTGARTSLPPTWRARPRRVAARRSRSASASASASRPTSERSRRPARDGVVVASALVDALGEDGRDIAALGRLVRSLREAGATLAA
jgi:tryptophan synthase alpha chain